MIGTHDARDRARPAARAYERARSTTNHRCPARDRGAVTWRAARVLALVGALPAVAFGEVEASSVPSKFGITRTFGLAVGQPLGASASAALIIGSVPATHVKCAFSYWSKGAFVQLEPGLGGAKASLGWANSNGLFGAAAKGTALRTWGKAWGTESGVTYLGPEAELVMFGRLSVGWLWRTGSHRGKRRMLTWGIGIGF